MRKIDFGGRGVRRRAGLIPVLILLMGGGLVACENAAATIARLAVGSPGEEPYTLLSGTDEQRMQAQPKPGPQQGDRPGLYGGTRKVASCDPARLVQFLQRNPDKAKAWAGVHRIGVQQIPAFVGRLTPVTLRTDTLVTNHGYRSGKATDLQALLQAGTGVLVDEYGAPKVKCNCGNPLTAPAPKTKTHNAKYTGPSWPQFSRQKITTIRPRDTRQGPLTAFVLVDPTGTTAFSRPRATTGESDGAPAPVPPGETTVPTDAPSDAPGGPPGYTPSAEPTGDVDPGLSGSPNATPTEDAGGGQGGEPPTGRPDGQNPAPPADDGSGAPADNPGQASAQAEPTG